MVYYPHTVIFCMSVRCTSLPIFHHYDHYKWWAAKCIIQPAIALGTMLGPSSLWWGTRYPCLFRTGWSTAYYWEPPQACSKWCPTILCPQKDISLAMVHRSIKKSKPNQIKPITEMVLIIRCPVTSAADD